MSNDQELMNVAGRHTDYDTVADLPVLVDHETSPGEVDLATDPFQDDLVAELRARTPRSSTPRTTLTLGGLVLVVGGFLGGVLVQSNFGNSATPTAAANGPGDFGGAGLGGGGFGGAGLGGAGQAGQGRTGPGQTAVNATTGTVKLVDGTTVYLTTADGQVVTVKTSDTTEVKLEQAGSLTDLVAGATVTVVGTTGTDGILTATDVTAEK